MLRERKKNSHLASYPRTKKNVLFSILRTLRNKEKPETEIMLLLKIKVLCEQTRELTHDFLDYV